ncbi:MAG: zinc-binding dehydrogenase [Planctomycetota bacterium]|nr:zinc-binding dehydrogenase [Planctomycetota bacterium]
MRAITITKQAPKGPVTPNITVVNDWPEPDAPAAGEATLRVEATALNHMDLWVGMGIPGVEITYPHIGGCVVCAVVEMVGAGFDDSWIGRRVIMNAAVALPERERPDDPPATTLAPNYQLIGEHHKGAHRERFNAPVSNLAPVGDADPVEAAAFGLTFLTAWSMMLGKGNLRPGQSVLITGIGGGVSTAALRIAKWLGCPAVVTSRHQWKLDRAAEMGADHTVLDDGADWSKAVRAWTSKRGVDMAVDSSGKATHLNCIKSLARGGAYVTPGCTSGPDATTDLARIFWNQLRIFGSTMGTNDEFRQLAALFRTGALKPVVDSTFAVADAPKAWGRLEDAEQLGKIVITWN